MGYKQQKYAKAKNKRFKGLSNSLVLQTTVNECDKLLKRFFTNVNHILKRDKLSYYKILKYYKSEGITIDKGYISKLNNGINKTCNILILQFIASYLNIPLIELLTNDYTLNDKEIGRAHV